MVLASSILKYLDFPSEFKISEILGVGKLSVTERSLTWRKSKTQRVSPVFLVTGTRGEDQGDELGSMTSFFNHKSSCACKLSLRFGGTGLIFWLTGRALGINSILNVSQVVFPTLQSSEVKISWLSFSLNTPDFLF